ncbi:MAG: hypothetical protein DHS20C11_31200 [Lysobacteraceae bacterium]|nr:MAG: hypothetical protein DHS20C11_31200 [Xanthomonadaceae bacterium]
MKRAWSFHNGLGLKSGASRTVAMVAVSAVILIVVGLLTDRKDANGVLVGEEIVFLYQQVDCDEWPSWQDPPMLGRYCIDTDATVRLPGKQHIYASFQSRLNPALTIVANEQSVSVLTEWSKARQGQTILLQLGELDPLAMTLIEPVKDAFSVSGSASVAAVVDALQARD